MHKGIEGFSIKVDVTKEGEVEQMVKAVVDKWGRLDIGVNNAGIACTLLAFNV